MERNYSSSAKYGVKNCLVDDGPSTDCETLASDRLRGVKISGGNLNLLSKFPVYLPISFNSTHVYLSTFAD